jgi:uncharacterized protein (DUF362 family)/NAD-dependent dihydropyrimidine dehydrogenase PreA subunit
MKTNVYVIKCESYEKADEKINELINMMGGISLFAKKGEKITLKANLLGAVPPEKAVSTHPSIVAAVGKLAKNEGAIPLIADSPGSGYLYNEATLKKLYKTCGMYDAAEQAGIDVNMDTGYERVSFPQGKLMKQIDVINPITQADAVINICKMKTHLYMHVTGAVKNHFGIIPGLSKVGFHAKLFDKERFADMLLDLSLYVAPRLTIMDAVLAMEGEGPGASGTPRHVGLLLASTSDLALDVVAGEIMGLPNDNNPVLMAAKRREASPYKIEDVNVIGEELSSIKITNYKFPSTVKGFSKAVEKNPAVRNLLKSALTKFPVVAKERCIGCGMCATACPQKMITLIPYKKKKVAVINLKDCIRCYCCHELCPHKAIDMKSKFISKALKI